MSERSPDSLSRLLDEPPPDRPDRRRFATAFDLESGDLLYSEEHLEQLEDDRVVDTRVLYRDPGEVVFAEKVLLWDGRPRTPSFEFVDHRTGLREGAKLRGPSLELHRREEHGAERRHRTLELPDDAVVDAGFHQLVVERWDELVEGRPVPFRFAVPSERRFFDFRLRRSATVSRRDREAHELTMEVASFLLRLLVDPVVLVVSPERELLEYRGISNIRGEDGDMHRARIVFDDDDGD